MPALQARQGRMRPLGLSGGGIVSSTAGVWGYCAVHPGDALITHMVNKATLLSRAPAREYSAVPGSSQHRRRGRGRPRAANAEDIRQKLLTAARELFLRYGYRAVSSRQIGAAAGVNFALIRYYFGGKPGLYREILQTVLPPDVGGMLGAPQEGGREMRITAMLSIMTRERADIQRHN